MMNAYALRDIRRSIGECECHEQIPRWILHPVQTYLGACAASFSRIRVEDVRLVHNELSLTTGSFHSLTPMYRESMFREDPLYRSDMAVPNTLFGYIEHHEDEAPRLRTYCRTFLEAHGIGDCLGVYYPVEGVSRRSYVSVVVARRLGQQKFSRDDMDALEDLSPLLRLALAHITLKQECQQLFRLRGFVGADTHTCASGRQEVGANDTKSVLPRAVLDLGEGLEAAYRKFGITEREKHIVELLQGGHSNLSMAHSLGISIRTVENHLRAIYAKTSVNSRTQLLSRINSFLARSSSSAESSRQALTN
jgi:DNA-binding CsgD family transcriptional regulator